MTNKLYKFSQQFNAMIIAYCLSVYAINFFKQPTFSTFKLRLINQQTGDCTDSTILDAKKISPSDFPVLIKLKGGERLLMKVKLLAVQPKQNEKLMATGVVNFSKNDIDNSLRVPIYDNRQGIEEVALCSIDFFVSGFLHEKGYNVNLDKSRSNNDDWRQRSQDAVYSQMSYTVESENQQKDMKAESKVPQTKTIKHTNLIGKGKERQNNNNSFEKVEEHDAQIHNDQKKHNKHIQNKTNDMLKYNQSSHQKKDNSVGHQQKEIALPLENSIYLSSPRVRQQSTSIRVQSLVKNQEQKNNIQKDSIDEFLKDQTIRFKNKQDGSEIGQYKSIQSPEKLIQKVQQNQKLLKQLKKYLLSKRIQEESNSSRNQQIKQRHSKIRRKHANIEQLKSYRLYDQKQQIISKKINDSSFREPYYEPIRESDLKKRINSFSQQPWGYVKSYSEQAAKISKETKSILQNIDDDLKRTMTAKSEEDKKNIGVYQNTNQSLKKIQDRQLKKTANKKKHKFDQKQYKFLIKKFYTSDQRQSQYDNSFDKLRNKNLLQNNSKHKKKAKKEPKSIISEEQLSAMRDINQIRNGNRNNFKFKVEKQENKLKQFWEKLIIKKKLQEDRAEKKQIQKHRRSVDSAISKKRQKIQIMNQSSILDQSNDSINKSKLYGIIPSKSKAKKVYQSSRPIEAEQIIHTTNLYPLRNISIEIKNISITQPQIAIDGDITEAIGKFVRISIKDKIAYFTQIIFNGEFNSILWRLEGCIFPQLSGNQKLQVQVYETIDNKITSLGKSYIRVNKLHFLRNNHIYNGQFIYQNRLNGQYTLSFDIAEESPFEIIEEEDEQIKVRPNVGINNQSKNRTRFKTVGSQQNKNNLLKSNKKNKDQENDGGFNIKNTLKKQSKISKIVDLQNYNLEVTQKKQMQESMMLPSGLRQQQ